MRNRMLTGVAVVAVAALASAMAAEGINLEGVKCVVAGQKDAKAAYSADYKGGKVFFCCPNCPQAFAGDTAKFAAAANHQLAVTGQAKQVACPFTGEAANSSTKIKVGGVEVAFCCDMCKAEAEASKEQIALIFGDKAFDKGFKVGK